MMKKISIIILTFFLFVNFNYSQITEVENVKTGKTDNRITLSETGMYKGTKSEKANEFYNKANDYFKNRDYKNAGKYYKKAIEEDTSFVEAYDNLALSYRKMKKFDKAINYYKKSIALYPDGHMAHMNLASAYLLKKDYENSIKEYQILLKLSPEDPEGYYGIANVYMTVGKYDDALKNAKQALNLYQKSNSDLTGDAYYLIGMIYYYKNDRKNAEENFLSAKNKGIKLHPQIEKDFFSKNQDDIPLKTKDDYINTEQTFIDDYNWIFKESMGTNPEKRKMYSRFIIRWVSGCPYINVNINEKIVKYPKCGNCVIIFMGGWVNYALQNKDYNNVYKGALNGTEDIIQFYFSNKEVLGKNKGIEKLIKMKNNNTLKDYIKSNI